MVLDIFIFFKLHEMLIAKFQPENLLLYMKAHLIFTQHLTLFA